MAMSVLPGSSVLVGVCVCVCVCVCMRVCPQIMVYPILFVVTWGALSHAPAEFLVRFWNRAGRVEGPKGRQLYKDICMIFCARVFSTKLGPVCPCDGATQGRWRNFWRGAGGRSPPISWGQGVAERTTFDRAFVKVLCLLEVSQKGLSCWELDVALVAATLTLRCHCQSHYHCHYLSLSLSLALSPPLSLALPLSLTITVILPSVYVVSLVIFFFAATVCMGRNRGILLCCRLV